MSNRLNHSAVPVDLQTTELASDGRAWRFAWPLAVLACAVLAIGPAFASLSRHWLQVTDYHHGYLVLAMSLAWLLWRLPLLTGVVYQWDRLATTMLFMALFAWIVAYHGSISLVMQLLAPLIVWLAVRACCGAQTGRWAFGPALLLYCAVPIWDSLVPVLQALTVAVASLGLRWVGVPIQVDGANITLADGLFTIAEGCSGKRFLMVMVTLAAALAIVNHIRGRRLLWLLLIAVASAVAMNCFRVISIIYLGHVTHMRHYLVAVEHISYGWVLFCVALLPVLAAGRYFAADVRTAPLPPAVNAPPVPPAPRGWQLRASVMPMLLLLACGLQTLPQRDAGRASLQPFPVLNSPWQGPLSADYDWSPQFVGASDAARVAYVSGAQRVEVYANVYAVQNADSKLVSERNELFDSSMFQLQFSAPTLGLPRSVRGEPRFLTAVRDDGSRWQVGYVYQVGGFLTASPLLAQMYYGLREMGGNVPGGVLAFAIRCDSDCAQSESVLRGFWQQAGGDLRAVIPSRTHAAAAAARLAS